MFAKLVGEMDLSTQVSKAVGFAFVRTMDMVLVMELVILLASWEAAKRVNLKVFQEKPSTQFVDVNGIQGCKIVLRVSEV